MDPLMLVLRLFHIVGGVLWVGGAFLFVAFIGPAAAATAPASGSLLSHAVKQRHVATFLTTVAVTTVIAGWLMWARFAMQGDSVMGWVGSTYGLVLTIGGVLATVAAYFGITGVGNNVVRLVDVGDEVAASGGPPSAEQAARLAHLSAEIRKHGMIDIVLLVLAVAAMATAAYW